MLRDRTFGPFLLSNLVSNAGSWFQVIGAVLLVYELTGSARVVSLVSVVNFGMFLLLSPVAGAVGDRFDRRRVLLVTHAVSVVASGALALAVVAGVASVPVVLGLTGLLALAQVFTIPALLAIVPALVRPADLTAAIGLNTVVLNVARVVGPAVAAVVIARFGVGAAFGLNAATFLVPLAVLARLRPRHSDRVPAGRGAVLEGIRHVRRHPTAPLLLVAVAALGVSLDPTSTMTAPLADRLGGGEALVGWFVSAFGVGAVAASPLVGRIERAPAVRGDVVGLSTCAVALVVLGLSSSAPLALAAYGLLGAGYLVGLTETTARLQTEVPDEMRGRLMGLWSQVLLGARPFAAALAGWLTDVRSTRVALLVLAAAPAVAVLVVRRAPPTTTGAHADP